MNQETLSIVSSVKLDKIFFSSPFPFGIDWALSRTDMCHPLNLRTHIHHDEHHSEEEGHSLHEVRRLYTTNDISWLPMRNQWKVLRSVAMVEMIRELLGTEKREVQAFRCYYISSLTDCNAVRMSGCILGHWSVENNLHWQLDVTFQEDQSRLRKGNGAQNMSRLRRITLNLIKSNKITRGKARKGGIKTRRGRAGWDNDFLLEILTGTPVA